MGNLGCNLKIGKRRLKPAATGSNCNNFIISTIVFRLMGSWGVTVIQLPKLLMGAK